MARRGKRKSRKSKARAQPRPRKPIVEPPPPPPPPMPYIPPDPPQPPQPNISELAIIEAAPEMAPNLGLSEEVLKQIAFYLWGYISNQSEEDFQYY